MSSETLILWLVVGAIAGWLAGIIVRGYGFGLVGNIVVGIIGAFVGGWIFIHTDIGLGGGIIGQIFGATIGAIVLLFLIRLVRRVA
ncbi:MAG: GlsB/YeaQ/YmgE family stress response membrane protein [Pseudomonadota bacterium]